ncbi:MAG TPA: outer membrane lipoprotein-sorting protein [Chthoniobacterales bacterium]|nr:outer membrane lipoprotein-sorting protein [Chthoniobacterales bacterium]
MRQITKTRIAVTIRALLAASTLQLFTASTGSAEPAPSARDILESVRMRQAQQQIDLHGQLRQDEVVVPFQLLQTGAVVRYIFTKPDETLQLQLGEKDSRLDEVTREGTEKVKPAQFDRKIRGTELTYEDLALKFLYWPNSALLGSENVRTRNCWKLELRPPSKQSQYSRVLLWVDKGSGALMRMEGYDPKGQLAKRFEVVSAQKIEDRWFLKQMRIETLQPGTNRVVARMYLEIKKS